MPGRPRGSVSPRRPTGYFHVGSARTALFNWLVARQSGGTFVLRIEDTDAERNREEWVDGIISAMHWLGMDADEGPYRQSLRSDRYHQAVDALWDAGQLYACGCTHDEMRPATRRPASSPPATTATAATGAWPGATGAPSGSSPPTRGSPSCAT